MIELRHFIADYFTTHIRAEHTPTASSGNLDEDQHNFQAFIRLVTYSPAFFARARAVVPELQLHHSEDVSHLNLKIEALLKATMDLRGGDDRRGQDLPEEIVWQKHLDRQRELERETEKLLTEQAAAGISLLVKIIKVWV